MSVDPQPQQPVDVWELVQDVLSRRAAGENLTDAEVEAAHPALMPKLGLLLKRAEKITQAKNTPIVLNDTVVSEESSPPCEVLELPRPFGNYELLELVSIGGMGTVYRAIQNGTGRIVALKMIRDQKLADQAAFSRFEREAKAASKLNHPNIVTVYEIGCEEGYHFISMQFVDGMNLEELVSTGPIPGRAAGEIMVTIADALQVANDHGVIHRDIKPSNVLINRGGIPYVTDFGLAREMNSDNRVTQSGSLVGSPSYMSPEQASGNSDATGPRSEVYSLGTVLYEMLVQRPPFVGASVALTILQVVNEPPLRPKRLNPDVEPDLETICLKCLEKKPSRRYGSPGELANDLRRWLSGHAIKARPTTWFEHTVRWAQREKTLAAAVGIALALLIGLLTALGSRNYIMGELLTTEAAGRVKAVQSKALLEKSLYISDMNQAQNALDSGELNYLTVLLDKYREPTGTDHRGFEWFHLWRRKNFAQQELKSLDFGLLGISVSPDCEMLALCGRNKRVLIYSSQSLEPLAVLKDHTTVVESVSFSPQGNYVGTACYDSKVRIYDTASWDLKYELSGHKKAVHHVFFSLDESRVIACGFDNTVRAWDMSSGTETQVFEGHEGQVHAAALSPDQETLVSGARDGTIRFWDFESGQLQDTVRIPNDCKVVRDVAYSPSGNQVVAATTKGRIHIFDASSHQRINTIRPHRAPVSDIAFSPNSKSLASVGEDGKLCITDTDTWTLSEKLSGHADRVYGVVYGALNNQVYTVAKDGTLRLWQTNRKFDEVLPGHSWTVWEMDFTADSKYLVSGGAEGRMLVWNAQSSRLLREIPGHADEVNTVSISPDGSRIVSGSDDMTVRIWDFESGEELHRLTAHTDDLTDVEVHPAGTTFLSTCRDKTARKWDLQTGELLETLDTDSELTSLAIHPTGEYFVVGDREGRLHFCDFESFAVQHTIEAHSDQAAAVAFSPDGRWLASGGRDAKLKLIDVKTREQIQTIEADITFVEGVSFSPDGKTVATGGGDSIVKLWDVETGKQRGQFSEHKSRVYAVRFSPDGKALASGSEDALIYMRRIEPFVE